MSPPRGTTEDASLARLLPGFEAQHAARQSRRGWTLLIVGILLVGAALGLFLSGHLGNAGVTHSTSSASSSAAGSHRGTAAPQVSAAPPPVSAALSSTKLAAPIDGALVLPGTGSQLVIVGGAATHGSLAQGVFTLDTSTGKLVHVGNLATALRNAAGAVIGGQDVVFGGTSSAATPAVQALPAAGGAAGSTTPSTSSRTAVQTATGLGSLPKPRADAAAVTIGATTYLVGGDDGTTPDPAVLATVDGRTFSAVASLPKPVRSPAVAALGRAIYVFGGQVASASGGWSPVDTIQRVDTATHKVQTVGHLPQPLSDASAVTFGNRVLILGGITAPVSQAPAPGSPGPGAPGTAAGGSPAATPAIWSFRTLAPTPSSVKKGSIRYQVAPAGQLPQPVADTGVAVIGAAAWLVGGQSNGVPVAAIQTVALQAPPAPNR